MSTNNRLDKYVSHSVHYVVLAARSTEDLRAFSTSSDQANATALSAINDATTLGAEVKVAGKSGVFLMMDTRRFSQFVIESFEIDTLISGFSMPGSVSPNSAGMSMKFSVQDNTGISFINFLQYLMDQKLGVSQNGMVLLVKILFVGEDRDGNVSTIQSIGIPAIFDQISLDLNGSRGVYACSLHPLIGMPSSTGYNAKWTSIGTASSFFSGTGNNTLGGVVNSFERNLNEQCVAEFNKLQMQVQNPGGKTVNVKPFGRFVQYMITLPAGWDTFVFSGPSTGGAKDINFKELLAAEEAKRQQAATAAKSKADKAKNTAKATNSSVPAKDSYVAVDPDLTVTSVLDVIFAQCVEVAQLGNFTHKADASGNIVFYKHLISVTSDDTSFTVHVDVVEFTVPNVDLAAANAQKTADIDSFFTTVPATKDHGPQKIPKNFLEFDYIFSGKNLDVINLDLKFENLNWMLQQGVRLGQGELFGTSDASGPTKDGDGSDTNKTQSGATRFRDPILLPQRTYMESKNFSNLGPNATSTGEASPQSVNQQYIRNMSAFYTMSPINTKMEIRGNPDLLADVSFQAIAKHVSAITITDAGEASATNQSVKTEYRKTFELDTLKLKTAGQRSVTKDNLLTGPSTVASPVFVKVNIFGPNVDFSTNQQLPGPYAQELFYDNFYWLKGVSSKIEGAKFTQSLDLTSYSVYGTPTGTAGTKTTANGSSASAVKKV